MAIEARDTERSEPIWKVSLIALGLFGFSWLLYRTLDTGWPMGSVVMVISAIPTYFFVRHLIVWSFSRWMLVWVAAAIATAVLERIWGGP